MESLRGAYILKSPSFDRFYIGQTANLAARLASHFAGETRSTKMTRDWLLVFFERTATLQEAMALEHRIKKAKSRKSIERFIRDSRNEIKHPISLEDFIVSSIGGHS